VSYSASTTALQQAADRIHAVTGTPTVAFSTTWFGRQLGIAELRAAGFPAILHAVKHTARFDFDQFVYDPSYVLPLGRFERSHVDPKQISAGLQKVLQMAKADGWLGACLELDGGHLASIMTFHPSRYRRFAAAEIKAATGMLAGIRDDIVRARSASLAALPAHKVHAILRGHDVLHGGDGVHEWLEHPGIRARLARGLDGSGTSVSGAALMRWGALSNGTTHLSMERTTLPPLPDPCRLTPLQREIYAFAIAGATVNEVADTVTRTPDAVRSQIRAIYRLLGVHCRADLVTSHYRNWRRYAP